MKNYYLKTRKIDYQILDGIADLVRVLDAKENVVFANKAMSETLGYDKKNYVCDIDGTIFNPEITKRVLNSGEIIQRNEIIKGKEFSVKCSPVHDENKNIIGVVEVFRNITIQKKLQREIIEKNNFMTTETIAASRIQQTMLPEKGFIKNISVDYMYKPYNILSGDMFDVFEIDSENIAIYIADSVGHGFAASMVTMFIKSIIRTLPGDVLLNSVKTLEYINERFATLKLDIENYFTCFYGVYNTKKNVYTYANAGHMPFVMKISDGEVSYLEAKGYPISRFFKNASYEENSCKCYCSDRLLFMTDGVIESRNPLKEVYGLSRVEKIMKKHSKDEIKYLEEDLNKFMSGTLKDDISCMIVKFY